MSHRNFKKTQKGQMNDGNTVRLKHHRLGDHVSNACRMPAYI
jgi:hypothetical protein